MKFQNNFLIQFYFFELIKFIDDILNVYTK